MKKLLLFLTLLSASHIAYGAEQQVLNQNHLNLWYSIVDPSQCNPQNMNPQEALDACKKNDNSFYFDLFIEKNLQFRNARYSFTHCHFK